MSSNVATGGHGEHVPPMLQSGRVMGIAEIPEEKLGHKVGVPGYLGQTNYADICILVTKYQMHFEAE